MARICPLFSSSRGNSTYIGDENVGVLIDVGKSAKQIEQALVANNINVNAIKAIFITHEHSDHIQGLRIFASRYKLKVFASSGTIEALEEKGILNNGFPSQMIGVESIEICGMSIKAFETPHDSSQSVGYVVDTVDYRRAVIATDIGYITDTVRTAISGSDVVLIESNHDVRMLQNGVYPYYLKKRILSDIGHLSNDACARELPNFVNGGTNNFILAHLSQENNMPELAYETSICQLSCHHMANGRDFRLVVAPPQNMGVLNVNF